MPSRRLTVPRTHKAHYVEKEDNTAFATCLESVLKASSLWKRSPTTTSFRIFHLQACKTHVLKRMDEDGVHDITADLVKSMSEMYVRQVDESAGQPPQFLVARSVCGAVSVYDSLAVVLDGGEAQDGDGEELAPVAKVARIKKEAAGPRCECCRLMGGS